MNIDSAIQIATGAVAGFEGMRQKAYWDVNGYAIGYGNHYYQDGSAVQPGDTITDSDAKTLLADVVAGKESAIRSYVTAPLTDYQYAALISLAYNCGEGNVRKSKVLQLINAQAPEDQIRDQWLQTCITAGGQLNDDLVNRRTLEWFQLYATPVSEGGVGLGGVVAAGVLAWLAWHVIK